MDNRTLEMLLLYAFRYALGRKTYAVYEVINALKAYNYALSDYAKELIEEEVASAIRNDRAGMDTDKQAWRNMVEYIKDAEI